MRKSKSNFYATKADFKTATGVDTSKFAKKVDLANLKSNKEKLDIDKLKNVPTNLSNLKNKVGNSVSYFLFFLLVFHGHSLYFLSFSRIYLFL